MLNMALSSINNLQDTLNLDQGVARLMVTISRTPFYLHIFFTHLCFFTEYYCITEDGIDDTFALG